MPGFFNTMTKGLSYVGQGIGAGAGLYGRGVSRFGGANMATAAGAATGAMYGATFGRDPGQGVLGGAFTGALGGAALGRYGRSAALGAMSGTGFRGRLTGSGQFLWSRARRDAVSSYGSIGRGARHAYNRVRSTLKTTNR